MSDYTSPEWKSHDNCPGCCAGHFGGFYSGCHCGHYASKETP